VNSRVELLSDLWQQRVGTAVDWLAENGLTGSVGLVLGSGLGNFVDSLTDITAVDYGKIPGFHTTSVAEHSGRMVSGKAGDTTVLVMQGRLHPYEGLPYDELLLPIAVLAGTGINSVVLTNAAGGLNHQYEPGDLMVIRDHVDMHTGDPLRGLLNDKGQTVRSLRPSPVYNRELSRLLVDTGAENDVAMHTGVYASMWGPCYETRAEIGMLRRMGCDTVGMSTAAEAALLSRLGVKVAGISCVTNPAREVGQPELSHQDVVETGLKVRDKVSRLLLAYLSKI
jgi:purine-nucleoside phosphorylase